MDTFMDQLSKLPCKTPVEILHHLIESKVDHLVTIYTQEGFSFTGSGASAQTLKAGKQVVIFRIAEQGRNFYSNNVIYIPAEQISHLQIHDADKILNVLSFGAIPADLPRT